MRVVATKTINIYCECYPKAASALRSWKTLIESYEFKHFPALKEIFGSVDMVGSDIVVFNIKGNHFRLIVGIDYERQRAFVKWFGRHKEYDKLNPAEVKYEDPSC